MDRSAQEGIDVYDINNYNEAGLLLGIDAAPAAGPSSARNRTTSGGSDGERKKKKKKVAKKKSTGNSSQQQLSHDEGEPVAEQHLSKCQKKRLKKKRKKQARLQAESAQRGDEIEEAADESSVVPEMKNEWDEETSRRYDYTDDEIQIIPIVIDLLDSDSDGEAASNHAEDNKEPLTENTLRENRSSIAPPTTSTYSTPEEALNPSPVDSDENHSQNPSQQPKGGTHSSGDIFNSSGSGDDVIAHGDEVGRWLLNGEGKKSTPPNDDDDDSDVICFTPPTDEDAAHGNDISTIDLLSSASSKLNETVESSGNISVYTTGVARCLASKNRSVLAAGDTPISTEDSYRNVIRNRRENDPRSPSPPPRDYDRGDPDCTPTLNRAAATGSTPISTEDVSRHVIHNRRVNDPRSPSPPPYDRNIPDCTPPLNREVLLKGSSGNRTPAREAVDYQHAGGFDPDSPAPSPQRSQEKRVRFAIPEGSPRLNASGYESPCSPDDNYSGASGFDPDFSPPSDRGNRPGPSVFDVSGYDYSLDFSPPSDRGRGNSRRNSPQYGNPDSSIRGDVLQQRNDSNRSAASDDTILNPAARTPQYSSDNESDDGRDGGGRGISAADFSEEDEEVTRMEVDIKGEPEEYDEVAEDDDDDSDVVILTPPPSPRLHSPAPLRTPSPVRRRTPSPRPSPPNIQQPIVRPPIAARAQPQAKVDQAKKAIAAAANLGKRPAGGGSRKNPVPQKKARTAPPAANGNAAERPYQREIRRLQRTTHLVIPRLCFSRLVKEISEQIAQENTVLDSPPKWQSLALTALQEASELYLANLFSDSYKLSGHAKRATLRAADMKLLIELRGLVDPGHP